MRTRTKFVIASFSALVAYFIAESIMIAFGKTYPPEFTYCWFTAWTGELFALAGIKITGDRRNPYRSESINDDDIAG